MSSAGGVEVAGSQAFFCYQCDRVVNLIPSPNSDLLCPNCNGGFLEEYDHPSPPNPNPSFTSSQFPSSVFPPMHPFSDPFFSAPYSSGFSPFGPVSSGGAGARSPILFSSAGADFNPFEFLQNHLQTLRASGANIQFVIENHPSEQGGGGGFQLPSNLGDYFLGPGLEQLIQQLAENDPNRYGTPPASKKAVEGLPSVAVTDDLINSDSAQCAVCMNDFELGSEAKQMPCNHIYHSDCILPWLELHNSCPVCRYELPTDDTEYENRREGGGGVPRPVALNLSGLGEAARGGVNVNVGGGLSSGDASSEDGSQRSPNVERRFRISLPWPFSSFASSGGDNDGGQASGSSGQQGSEHGQGPRQEGLD